MKNIKRYTHDCGECEFLGQYKEYDLYYCEKEPTVIARYGNDGPEYMSGISFVGVSEPLTIAYKRWKNKNYES